MAVSLPRGTLIAAAVVLVAALDLRVAIRGNGDELSELMRAAGATVAKVQQPGDILVHSPLFGVRELQALGEFAGSSAVPAEQLRRTRRVVVLDRADEPMFSFGDPARVEEVPGAEGLLEVRVYEPAAGAGDAVLYSLKDSLAPATMRVERNGQITSRCNLSRPDGGYSCPGEAEWLYAALRPMRVEEQDAVCVWAHPTTGGVIIFELPAPPPPPAGRRLLLEVSSALSDEAVRLTPDGAAVRTEIQQRGVALGHLTLNNRIGWVKTRAAVEAGAPIELRITTPNDGRRHHCINAELIDGGAGAGGGAQP